jgi:lambda repressor-like predicted transcriptional regulator
VLSLEKNRRVDWFRVIIDLNEKGISMDALASMTGIPRSTVQGWKYRNGRPKFEEAISVLNIWAEHTCSDLDHIPVYDPYSS